MTFPEFFRRYQDEAGCALPLVSVIRNYYAECNLQDEFDWPPPRIKTFLESKHPVGLHQNEAHIGNVGDVRVADRALVVSGGELQPRDLTADEFELHARPTQNVKHSGVLTRNAMSVRGWGRRPMSRADWLASMKTE